MTYPMLLGHCPVISLFPGPGVKAPASDSENLEAATAKVWPLELPTGQEPGMALELGTERAKVTLLLQSPVWVLSIHQQAKVPFLCPTSSPHVPQA